MVVVVAVGASDEELPRSLRRFIKKAVWPPILASRTTVVSPNAATSILWPSVNCGTPVVGP